MKWSEIIPGVVVMTAVVIISGTIGSIYGVNTTIFGGTFLAAGLGASLNQILQEAIKPNES